jgi:uncharacterized membrane protein HdeD (DUF308 family)
MNAFAGAGGGWVEPVGPSRFHVLIWSACSALLGLLLLVAPVASAAALATIVAACWLLGGVVSAVVALRRRGHMWGWRLAAGVAGALGGLLVLAHPLVVAFVVVESLFLVLATMAFLVGCVTLFSGHSIGTALLGLALLAVGLLLLLGSLQVLTLVSLVQWIGLFSIAGALVSGVAAVAGHTGSAGP